jgi:uncharacterized membrane protein
MPMDEASTILFFGGLVLLVLFGPWILVLVGRRRRKRQRAEDQERWGDLTKRVFALEEALRQRAEASPPLQAERAPIAEVREAAPPPAPASSPPQTPVAPAPTVQAAETWIKSAAPVEPPEPAAPSPAADIAPPTFAEVEHEASFTDHLKSGLNLEETLGTNWLNKLGITLLVLGIASFLAYQLKTLGPAGKVLVGYVTSVVMLGIGVWSERHDRYRILARAGIGGGWALLFFTTYAMYHVPAAHVLSSQAADLILMLAVASAMVWHTLRYRSQVVTGLAFLLAFLTVTISHDTVYSLSAGGVLAAGLVVIVGRMQWFELEIFGILASYLNHYLWLRPIIEPMQGHHRPFPEFFASAGLLAVYWIIFRMSYVFRLPSDERQEHISTGAALLNTALLLALFKYQSTHPEWAFWALLTVGAIETALGQLPITRRRRNAVIVLSTLGVVLLIAAFPFRYSGMRLTVLWLLEAEALLLIGVRTREVVFRRLGALASLLVAGQILSVDAARIYGIRMDGADVHSYPRLAILFAVAAAVFYADAHWVARRWTELFTSGFDRRLMQRLSYVAAVMALVSTWIAFPQNWTAVAWGALGLVLAWLGRRFRILELIHQAHLVAVASLLRVAVINFADTTPFHGVSLRLITILAVAALFYATARWSGAEEWEQQLSFARYSFPLSDWITGTYTWAASLLLALLAWYELRAVSVAVVWVVGGLVLFELGFSWKSVSLRLQAYALFVAGFTRIFFVNLNAAGTPGEVSPRFYTVVPLALAFFYAQWRLHQSNEGLSSLERGFRVEHFCSYLGTVTVAALMRFELEADWVAAAWAALAWILIAVAWRSRLPVFLHQAVLVTLGVLFRTSLHNFYQRSYFPAPFWESRWVCVGAVVALLFLSLPIAFPLREKKELTSTGLVRLFQFFARRPEQVFFFTALILLTVLLALEMRHGMVTVSWGVEGVAVFLLALWVGERSFRLSGLGLLLLCVGKILFVDVWRLNPRDRYLTLIVLGGALLLVSFLYTRNRELIRQYL